jgi:hypothetical protein
MMLGTHRTHVATAFHAASALSQKEWVEAVPILVPRSADCLNPFYPRNMLMTSNKLNLAAMLAVVGGLSLVSAPAHANTGNPCAARVGASYNPCAAKAVNPCAAKVANPCAAKTANPCAVKAANPCAAKSPCAAKASNPCAAKVVKPRG